MSGAVAALRTLGVRRFARKLWHRLPLDGNGALPGGPRETRAIRRFLARARWQGFPAWARPLLAVAARAAWLVACPVWAAKVAAAPRDPRAMARAVWLGWTAGRHPAALPATDPATGADLLDDRQSMLLWLGLGDRRDIARAADKVATSQALAALGVPTVPILAEIPRGTAPAPEHLALFAAAPRFVKPRHGSQAAGAASVRPTADGRFSIEGGLPVGPAELALHLAALARRDSVLVQPLLRPNADTADLSPDAPVELRITTARPVGGASVVVSVNLKVQPPGRHAATTMTSALAVPVHPRDGTLLEGRLLGQLGERHVCVPWNGAPLPGRRLADLEAAMDAVVAGAAAFPGLAAIGWDVLLTDNGPVVLEANVALSWRFIHLPYAASGLPSPLPAIVDGWIAHRLG